MIAEFKWCDELASLVSVVVLHDFGVLVRKVRAAMVWKAVGVIGISDFAF